MSKTDAELFVDLNAECFPVTCRAVTFTFVQKQQTIPNKTFSKETPLAYESVAAAFWDKCKQIDENIKIEHDNCHCPKGQHVWTHGIDRFVKKCEICGLIIQECIAMSSCHHCGPNDGPSANEVRENEFRRMMWIGQKEGIIAAPIEKKSVMSFLWGKKK